MFVSVVKLTDLDAIFVLDAASVALTTTTCKSSDRDDKGMVKSSTSSSFKVPSSGVTECQVAPSSWYSIEAIQEVESKICPLTVTASVAKTAPSEGESILTIKSERSMVKKAEL